MAKLDQVLSKLARFGSKLASVAHDRAEVFHLMSGVGQVWPQSASSYRSLPDFGQHWQHLANTWAEVAEIIWISAPGATFGQLSGSCWITSKPAMVSLRGMGRAGIRQLAGSLHEYFFRIRHAGAIMTPDLTARCSPLPRGPTPRAPQPPRPQRRAPSCAPCPAMLRSTTFWARGKNNK